jgi:hypothetical protein
VEGDWESIVVELILELNPETGRSLPVKKEKVF